jgi:uncharacterized damage-inducible protein DinB
MKQALQQDIAYSAWASRRLLDACAALPIVDQTRDLKLSHRSVLGTLYHIYESERFWVECLQASAMPPMAEMGGDGDKPADLSLDMLEREWPKVWTGLDQWLASMSDEELTHPLRSRLPSGTDAEFTRWQLLRHSMNHSTSYRGQVVGVLRAMGRKPPDINVMGYYLRNY